jgi:hypothetical protein
MVRLSFAPFWNAVRPEYLPCHELRRMFQDTFTHPLSMKNGYYFFHPEHHKRYSKTKVLPSNENYPIDCAAHKPNSLNYLVFLQNTEI